MDARTVELVDELWTEALNDKREAIFSAWLLIWDFAFCIDRVQRLVDRTQSKLGFDGYFAYCFPWVGGRAFRHAKRQAVSSMSGSETEVDLNGGIPGILGGSAGTGPKIAVHAAAKPLCCPSPLRAPVAKTSSVLARARYRTIHIVHRMRPV